MSPPAASVSAGNGQHSQSDVILLYLLFLFILILVLFFLLLLILVVGRWAIICTAFHAVNECCRWKAPFGAKYSAAAAALACICSIIHLFLAPSAAACTSTAVPSRCH